MPHVNRRDLQLILSLLRRQDALSTEEIDRDKQRLMRRLQQRLEKSVEDVRIWRAGESSTRFR